MLLFNFSPSVLRVLRNLFPGWGSPVKMRIDSAKTTRVNRGARSLTYVQGSQNQMDANSRVADYTLLGHFQECLGISKSVNMTFRLADGLFAHQFGTKRCRVISATSAALPLWFSRQNQRGAPLHLRPEGQQLGPARTRRRHADAGVAGRWKNLLH